MGLDRVQKYFNWKLVCQKAYGRRQAVYHVRKAEKQNFFPEERPKEEAKEQNQELL